MKPEKTKLRQTKNVHFKNIEVPLFNNKLCSGVLGLGASLHELISRTGPLISVHQFHFLCGYVSVLFSPYI